MPIIARIDGIIIKMYFRQKEHNPPHVHAVYGEYMGVFSIHDSNMIEGDLPLKNQQQVKQFIEMNRNKLMNMWDTQKFEMI